MGCATSCAMQPPDPRVRLPLFPLPTVLFPGTAMPLHVFWYRDLVRHCLEHGLRFGWLYHDWERDGAFRPEHGRIGCIAEIREHHDVGGGHTLILVEGVERFAVSDGIESEGPYFEALVIPYRDDAPRDEPTLGRRNTSIRLFQWMSHASGEGTRVVPDPRPGGQTSFLLGQAVPVEPAERQRLLELRNETERLGLLDELMLSAARETMESPARGRDPHPRLR